MKTFPDIKTLAKAPLSTVLNAWNGLGYNNRAKRLHDTAKIISKEHNGKVPNTINELTKLPGIGPYTARAILIFADNQDIATVDTSTGRYDWTIPGLCDGVTPVTGEGLRLRLITPRGDSGAHYHADSVPINVKMPKIDIPWPFLPPIYHPADRISLSWTVEGNQLPADPRVNIKLYHNGSYLFTLANNVSTTFTGSTPIQAGTGNPWHGEIAPPGRNYKIRIEFVGCPQVYGETGNFTLLEAE